MDFVKVKLSRQQWQVVNFMLEHGRITTMDGINFNCTSADRRVRELIQDKGFDIEVEPEGNKTNGGRHNVWKPGEHFAEQVEMCRGL